MKTLRFIKYMCLHLGLRGLWCAFVLFMAFSIVLHCNRSTGADYALCDLLSVSAPASQHLSYTAFDVYFNPGWHIPSCVAYELTARETSGPIARTDQWLADDNALGCPRPDEYSGSGYDRGHMVPAADLKWSRQAMQESFYMTNICPQDHELNGGAWSVLEDKVRQWAHGYGRVIVFTGPIVLSADTVTIGPSHVRVPSAFYKIVACGKGDGMRAVAFVYPNDDTPNSSARELRDYAVTIDEVESLTGIDFFSAMPQDWQQRIEASTTLNYLLH